jgi:phosphate transport system substrate-binding protein
MEECRAAGIQYIELPVAFDALTVVVHPKNTLNEISIDDLKKMWEPAAQGKVTRWNQVNPAFPDAPLAPFGAGAGADPGADSGTSDYFTEAVNGKSKSSRGDFTASEEDNVLVQGVSRNTNAVALFGCAYFQENKDKLKGLPISWKGGKAVAPTEENVLNGTYQPLSRPIFIYVNAKALAQVHPAPEGTGDRTVIVSSREALRAVPIPTPEPPCIFGAGQAGPLLSPPGHLVIGVTAAYRF